MADLRRWCEVSVPVDGAVRPGLLFYLWAKKEHGEKPFKGAEAALAAIIVVLGAIAAYELITGQLTL
jgi:arginine:ornithine antiporter/lysine permease